MGRQHLATRVSAALLFVISLLSGPGAMAQSVSDYTSVPAFISNAVPPNILMIMDNSGSMNESAYHQFGEVYDPAKTYNGYFDPTKCYNYTSSKFNAGANRAPANPRCSSPDPWDGNFLNYIAITRFEIVKWVMIGGKCAPRAADGTCYPGGGKLIAETLERVTSMDNITVDGITPYTGARCLSRDLDDLQVYSVGCGGSAATFKLKVEIYSEPTGVLQQIGGDKARFGLMIFNKQTGSGTVQGGDVVAPIGGTMANMVKTISTTNATEWTPLGESLYEATRYFSQIAPAYANSNYPRSSQSDDPYYYQSPWVSPDQYVKCCKSFVIMFTDGQPTKDTAVPSGVYDYAHSTGGHALINVSGSGHCNTPAGCTVPHSSEPHISHGGGLTNHDAGATQIDHHDNCSSYYGGIASDSCVSNGSHYLDDVAYWAHTADLRPCNGAANGTIVGINETGKCLDGNQNLIFYAFYAFGSGATILQDAAKLGGFEDRNNNGVFDAGVDVFDRVNNYTGAAGADGLPDTYFESYNADDMRDKMIATINSILARSASGTSASVLANSSTGEGSLYQAYFFPKSIENPNVTWVGYTHGLWVDSFGNVREDTVHDGKLIYDQDYIIKPYYDPNNGKVKADRYSDSDNDGKANSLVDTVDLELVNSIWEAGRRLALKTHTSRKILTWIDKNGDGIVDSGTDNGSHTDITAGEVIPFGTNAANKAELAKYLRGETSPSVYTTDNLIDFVLGCEPATCTAQGSLRERRLSVKDDANATVTKVWKYGDPIHSTPTVVSTPRERYDVIYGDGTYVEFFKQYRSRRQMIYVGANDGMLHAFDGGFYHRTDGSHHGCFTASLSDPCSSQTTTPTQLGEEKWAFIPYQLLPHLKWLAQSDYSHVYYVDLKPKITDARIFTADADHPQGWGTILIGGFRMGGSCNCAVGQKGRKMSVTADFTGSGVTTRDFFSAYFVLDITNPEKDPKLLWSYSTSDLGMATSYPAVVRVKPSGGNKTDNTNAKWFVVFGSGPNGDPAAGKLPVYDGGVSQKGKMWAVNLATGPTSGNVVSFNVNSANASQKEFFGDLVSMDRDLDYRADVVYGGTVMDDQSAPWRGKMYRLTTGDVSVSPTPVASGLSTDPTKWGYLQAPTEVIDSFLLDGATPVTKETGPILAAPTVTLDDANKVWVFFGTGRYFSDSDKTDTSTQYFFGIKDSVLSSACTQSSATSCVDNDLVNISGASICTTCAVNGNVTGVTATVGAGSVTVTDFDNSSSSTSLVQLVKTKDGWVTTMPDSRERVLAAPALMGGVIFFPSFTPANDICVGIGTSQLYGLFYKTGTAHKDPILGVTTSAGKDYATRRVSMGEGMMSQAAIHIGGQGSGSSGTSSGSGCQGRVSVIMQSSMGALSGRCTTPVNPVYSRYISWVNNRD